MRDNWCIGFSDQYTVGVWVGNFNGSPMKDVSGVSGAAPLWRKVMDQLHENKPAKVPAQIAKIELPKPIQEGLAQARSSLSRILYPSNHAVLAYDPEIPSGHQKVFFRFDGPRDSGIWYLNGKKLASLSENYFWQVERGKYKLEIRDSKDVALDGVEFLVK